MNKKSGTKRTLERVVNEDRKMAENLFGGCS